MPTPEFLQQTAEFLESIVHDALGHPGVTLTGVAIALAPKVIRYGIPLGYRGVVSLLNWRAENQLAAKLLESIGGLKDVLNTVEETMFVPDDPDVVEVTIGRAVVKAVKDGKRKPAELREVVRNELVDLVNEYLPEHGEPAAGKYITKLHALVSGFVGSSQPRQETKKRFRSLVRPAGYSITGDDFGSLVRHLMGDLTGQQVPKTEAAAGLRTLFLTNLAQGDRDPAHLVVDRTVKSALATGSAVKSRWVKRVSQGGGTATASNSVSRNRVGVTNGELEPVGASS